MNSYFDIGFQGVNYGLTIVSFLITEFELTFSRRRLYIGLFMTVVSIATLITWGVADKASVSICLNNGS